MINELLQTLIERITNELQQMKGWITIRITFLFCWNERIKLLVLILNTEWKDGKWITVVTKPMQTTCLIIANKEIHLSNGIHEYQTLG